MPRERTSPHIPPPAAELLRAWVAEKGVTLRYLAAHLEVAEGTLWAWLSGRNGMGLEVAAALEVLTEGAVPAAAWVDGETARWRANTAAWPE